jgi:hypothetical protein
MSAMLCSNPQITKNTTGTYSPSILPVASYADKLQRTPAQTKMLHNTPKANATGKKISLLETAVCITLAASAPGEYTAFHIKLLFWSLIIQRAQNADTCISHHSMDNQAPKKEHLMKSGIAEFSRVCAYRRNRHSSGKVSGIDHKTVFKHLTY